MVGAGVLGLPSAMSYLEWPGGCVMLTIPSRLHAFWAWTELICGFAQDGHHGGVLVDHPVHVVATMLHA